MRRAATGCASISAVGGIVVGDVADYVTEHGGLSRETLRKGLSVISGAFAYATRHLGYSGANPVLLLERSERPRGDSKPKRILGPGELRQLLLATDPLYRLAVRFLAETGVRVSEMLGVVWADVDVDGETVEVAWQLDARTRRRVKLKTDRSRRAIPITGGLAGELRNLRPQHAGNHEFVFGERDGRPFSPWQVERAVNRAATRAGLGNVSSGDTVVEHAPTPHDLRHSHASALIASGWDVESVSRRLGHANSAITLSIYTHEFESARRQAEQRRSLETLYGSAVEAKERSASQQTGDEEGAEVAVFQAKRSGAQ
jgi:integrase